MSCPITNSNYTNLHDYLTNGNNEYSSDQLMDCVTGDPEVDNVIDDNFKKIQDIFTLLDKYNKKQACWKRYKAQSSIGSSSSGGNQGWVNPINDPSGNAYCVIHLSNNDKNAPSLLNLDSYLELKKAIDDYNIWLSETSVPSGKLNKVIIQEQGGNDNIEVTELNSKHKNIKDLRNSLETSLKELKLNSNSNAKDSKLELDANIYVTLLWTTLATGIVYYTFTAL